MPKLWSDTIETHRRRVGDAILAVTARLVSEHGVRSVTMSHIAAETGIGRATLYKYFPDVEAILVEWHRRQVADHLSQMADLRSRATDASTALANVLRAFAHISYERHGTELAALVHRGEHVAHAHQELHSLVRDLLAEAAQDGDIRTDVTPEELARYCLHALTAASELTSPGAVSRLVQVTLAGLKPEPA